MSEWNASLQEIAHTKIRIALSQDQSNLEKLADEILAPLSTDSHPHRRDTLLSQIVAREKYLLALSKLVRLKSQPDADEVAVDTLIEQLVCAKLAYCATHELNSTL